MSDYDRLGGLVPQEPVCAPTCMALRGSTGWWWDCPRHGSGGPFDDYWDASASHACLTKEETDSLAAAAGGEEEADERAKQYAMMAEAIRRGEGQ